MKGRYPDLRSENVIVVGTGGIGGAIVKDFLEQRCQVFTLDRDPKVLERLTAIFKEDRKLETFVVDVTDHEKLSEIIVEIGENYGPIRSFVWTAGIGTSTPVGKFSDGLPENLFSLNVIAFGYGLKAVIPFLERGSSVTVIGSLNASRPEPGMAVYDATKAALTQYARTAAVDLGKKGIRVNAVAPGYVRTPQTEKELENPENAAKIANATILGRIAEPSDVSAIVVALASDDFAFLTGAVIPVDGGLALAQYSPIEKQVNK